jgi:hypothetical protein
VQEQRTLQRQRQQHLQRQQQQQQPHQQRPHPSALVHAVHAPGCDVGLGPSTSARTGAFTDIGNVDSGYEDTGYDDFDDGW